MRWKSGFEVVVGFNIVDPITGQEGHIARLRCTRCGAERWAGEPPACMCGREEDYYREPSEEELAEARRERRAVVVGWNFPYRSVRLLRCPFCGQEEYETLRCGCLDD